MMIKESLIKILEKMAQKVRNNMKKIYENINEIIAKKFSSKNNGYDPDEVDQTLDEIIEMFTKHENEINIKFSEYNAISSNNEKLKKKVIDLEHHIKTLKDELHYLNDSGVGFHKLKEDINILKRKVDDKDFNKKRK